MTTATSLTATYNGVQKTTTFTVNPAAAPAATLSALTLSRTSVVGGSRVTAHGDAVSPGARCGRRRRVEEQCSRGGDAVPASVTVGAGATSVTFTINTTRPAKNRSVTITATYAGVTRSAALTVKRN